MSFTSEVKTQLIERRRELQAELRQIEKALQAFEPTPAPSRRRRRKLVDKQAVLQVVKDNPGIMATKLAKQLNLPDGTAYSVLNRLKEADQVAKYGTGWYPIEQVTGA